MTVRLHMMDDMISWRRRLPGSAVSATQRDMCRRFAVEPSPTGQRTIVGFALSRPRELKPLNALRHPAAGGSNGWFVWRGPEIPQEDDKFFEPCTLSTWTNTPRSFGHTLRFRQVGASYWHPTTRTSGTTKPSSTADLGTDETVWKESTA